MASIEPRKAVDATAVPRLSEKAHAAVEAIAKAGSDAERAALANSALAAELSAGDNQLAQAARGWPALKPKPVTTFWRNQDAERSCASP